MLTGLALAGGAVSLAWIVHGVVDSISPLVVAVVIGVVYANTIGVAETFRPGLQFAAKRVLRVGIVLLGCQLSLTQLRRVGGPGLAIVAVTVAATFFGTRWVGRRLGLSPELSLLVATGYAICGASAIAAVEGVAGGDEDDVAYSIALVTACGSLAIVVLPVLGRLFGLDAVDYGNWVGASVHDVGQVVAAATPRGAVAVQAAVIVKLTRVVLLAPLVAGLTVARRHRPHDTATSATSKGGLRPARRPAIVPLFVAGFLSMIVLRSAGALPAGWLGPIKTVQTTLLGAALFGLGTGVNVARLRRVGGRPVLLGAISWVLVAGVALAGTHFVGRT